MTGVVGLAIGFCAVGCATKFSPEPDSGPTTGAAQVSGSGGGSGGMSSGSGVGESTSGSSGASSGGGASGGEAASGSSGGASGDGGSGAASGDGGHASVPTCPATSTLPAGDTNTTIVTGGMTRQYIVHIPTSYNGKTAVPLVIDYHPILLDYNYERQIRGMRPRPITKDSSSCSPTESTMRGMLARVAPRRERWTTSGSRGPWSPRSKGSVHRHQAGLRRRVLDGRRHGHGHGVQRGGHHRGHSPGRL